MRKSLLPVLMLTVFVLGCAHNSPKPDPLPPTCPAPPKLPPLAKPSHLEQSFLLELETALFRSRSEPTSYGLTPSPATGPTTAPGLRLKP